MLGLVGFDRRLWRHEEVEPALLAANFSDIDVNITDRIALELFLRRLVAVDSRLIP